MSNSLSLYRLSEVIMRVLFSLFATALAPLLFGCGGGMPEASPPEPGPNSSGNEAEPSTPPDSSAPSFATGSPGTSGSPKAPSSPDATPSGSSCSSPSDCSPGSSSSSQKPPSTSGASTTPPEPSGADKSPSDVPGANLSIGNIAVDGLQTKDIACKTEGGMALLGAVLVTAWMSPKKAELDACAPAGSETRVKWRARGGKVVEISAGGSAADRASGAGAKVKTCVERALKSGQPMLEGQCAATIVHGSK